MNPIVGICTGACIIWDKSGLIYRWNTYLNTDKFQKAKDNT